LFALKHSEFDIVLMDCSMPVMDGFAATREIRALEAADGRSELPIVALTAHVAGNRAQHWRDAGMSDYLSKPFTLKSLSACLGRWLTSDDCSAARTEQQSGSDASSDCQFEDLPIINTAVLDDIRAMQSPGDNLVSRIADLYRHHAPDALERIATAIDKNDLKAIADATHALKSLTRNIGAERLAALLHVIEGQARDETFDQSVNWMPQIRELVANVVSQLDSFIEVVPESNTGQLAS
jgi:CheY-like chemotaxis protein